MLHIVYNCIGLDKKHVFAQNPTIDNNYKQGRISVLCIHWFNAMQLSSFSLLFIPKAIQKTNKKHNRFEKFLYVTGHLLVTFG